MGKVRCFVLLITLVGVAIASPNGRGSSDNDLSHRRDIAVHRRVDVLDDAVNRLIELIHTAARFGSGRPTPTCPTGTAGSASAEFSTTTGLLNDTDLYVCPGLTYDLATLDPVMTVINTSSVEITLNSGAYTGLVPADGSSEIRFLNGGANGPYYFTFWARQSNLMALALGQILPDRPFESLSNCWSHPSAQCVVGQLAQLNLPEIDILGHTFDPDVAIDAINTVWTYAVDIDTARLGAPSTGTMTVAIAAG